MSATPARRALPTSIADSQANPQTTTIPSPNGGGSMMTVSPSSPEYLRYILSNQSSKRSRTRTQTRTRRARDRAMDSDSGSDSEDMYIPSILSLRDDDGILDERDMVQVWERDFELPSPVNKMPSATTQDRDSDSRTKTDEISKLKPAQVDSGVSVPGLSTASSPPQDTTEHGMILQDSNSASSNQPLKGRDLLNKNKADTPLQQIENSETTLDNDNNNNNNNNNAWSGDGDWKEGMKIIGVGHQADSLPLTNSQRMQLGLPLKPPPMTMAPPSSPPVATMGPGSSLKD
ncbi:hypothetical protein IAT40_000470 [Kwoniella sp. CBS 6097]